MCVRRCPYSLNILATTWQNQQNECAPSEDSDQPGHPPSLIRAQRRQISWHPLRAQWVAKAPSFLHADSEDSDQTGQMPRLIRVFAGRTITLLVLSCCGSYNVCHITCDTSFEIKCSAYKVPQKMERHPLMFLSAVIREMWFNFVRSLQWKSQKHIRKCVLYLEIKHYYISSYFHLLIWAPSSGLCTAATPTMPTLAGLATDIAEIQIEPRQANLCLRAFRHDKF